MHLRSRNLPRPSASSPPGNRSRPMANPAQAPDLEGLHREIHDMAEQMRIMNENNGRLIQLLAAANPPLPAAPLIPEVERSRHSNRSGNRSRNISADQVGRGRRQAPSSSWREKSSSESSKTPTRSRRGRSPRRGDHAGARDKSTSQKIRDLDARLDAINTGTNAPVTVDALVRQTDPPFTKRVLGARISSKFKLPTQLGVYEGRTDPMDHLDSYKSLMSLQGCSDEVMCRAFSATLKGPARNRQKNASHLFTVHQKETESLKDFVKRFNQAILEVEDPSDKVIIMAMMEGLRPGHCSTPSPKTFLKLCPHSRVKPTSISPRRNWPRPNVDDEGRMITRGKSLIRGELTIKRKQEIKHEEFVKWPGKIKTDPQKRNRNKYCEFHRDHGHNTEDCFQLREQIADLIKRGYLRKYITDRPPPNSQKGDTATIDQPRGIYKRSMEASDQVVVRLHPGKSMLGVPSGQSKKKFTISPRRVFGDQPPITFGSDDLRGLHLPHDDALVISAVIANFNVQRILIDSGSSADILFISAFEKMKIGLDKLHPFHCPSPYNAILGRPTLGGIKAITSTYHPEDEIPNFDWDRRRLVIRAPSGEQMEYAIRMGFKATNNEAEYEALLAD
ncbi:hypothetical protein Acr_14g0005730 [Actinidia rufa]|uniref:Retrotransposon gag domain-containing protein n=1 Tax=Actinidia rufa TaxID=165716 RepID=A0A7J0FSL9_9ERIC|nr:hypothetical protein Acr_14g0005730 [Actinidia rufa]